MNEDNLSVEQRFENVARNVIEQVQQGNIPELELPTRTKKNIVEKDDVWVYGDRVSTKSADSERTAKNLLKIAKTLEFLNKQKEEGRSSTLRELYYLSEGWVPEQAQFESQDQSNRVIEDLELITDVRREDMNMRAEESGASLIGPLKLKETTDTRGERVIHCQDDIGESGYTIPNDPDDLEFIDHDIEFVLEVETGGMKDRLVENGFDEEYNCLIVHLKGQPSRATRRLTKRLYDDLGVPILIFTDGDPWSYRIFGSIRYGSIKSAHLSKYLATPSAQFLGITPQDIEEYDLPSDDLSESDINALESLKEDDRFDTERWHDVFDRQLEIGEKAEQQALASGGLDFVSETYLPEKLRELDIID
jgi:DNA topoisomerase-6 subunit A